VLGMMFAPDHTRATAELARVCRPGGTVAVVAWSDGSWASAWLKRAARLVPMATAGRPTPNGWGDATETERRLHAVGLEAKVGQRPFTWRFSSTQEAADFFLRAAGPFIAFGEAAAQAGHGHEVRSELIAAMDETNTATDGSCELSSPYLLAVGRRPTPP